MDDSGVPLFFGTPLVVFVADHGCHAGFLSKLPNLFTSPFFMPWTIGVEGIVFGSAATVRPNPWVNFGSQKVWDHGRIWQVSGVIGVMKNGIRYGGITKNINLWQFWGSHFVVNNISKISKVWVGLVIQWPLRVSLGDSGDRKRERGWGIS